MLAPALMTVAHVPTGKFGYSHSRFVSRQSNPHRHSEPFDNVPSATQYPGGKTIWCLGRKEVC